MALTAGGVAACGLAACGSTSGLGPPPALSPAAQDRDAAGRAPRPLPPPHHPTPTATAPAATGATPADPIAAAQPGDTHVGHPLAGRVVGIDPGHNGGNYADPAAVNRLVSNGRALEACDTTGTKTDSGYTEAAFNFQVATLLAADLGREGARVVLTRDTNTGVGPCITTRAQIVNDAHADVAVDIHADGGPPTGRGFAILEPVADGPNDSIIAASHALAVGIRAAFVRTGMPTSTYEGNDGLIERGDLAGLNLTTVPKVLIECGNMRNATDAAMLTSASFQHAAADALSAAITTYETGS